MVVSDIFLSYTKILLVMGAKTGMYVSKSWTCNTSCTAVLASGSLDSVLGYETRVARLLRS